jgi:tetratricopeptide (TPR) repeat protein
LLAEKDGVIAATKMLDAAKPTVETAAYVELERAHVAIEADELAKALGLLLAKPDATEPRWPTLAASWFETGRALVRSGDSRRAVPFLRRFVELAPHDRDAAAALHMLAREAIDRGDGAMAKQCFERAEQIGRWHGYWRARMTQIREHPDEPLPWQGLAELWLQVGEIDRARAVLQRLVSFKPDFAPGWFLLGETDRKRNDLKAAEFSYTRCLAIDAEHLLARHNRGTIEQMSERHAEARADFEHIADGPRASEPLALNSHLQLVRVLDKLGETDAAAKRYARYAELGGKEPRQP